MEFEIVKIEEIKVFAVFEKGNDECLFSGKKKECKKFIEILPTIIEDFMTLLKEYNRYEVERKISKKYNLHISVSETLYRVIIQNKL